MIGMVIDEPLIENGVRVLCLNDFLERLIVRVVDDCVAVGLICIGWSGL